MLPKVLQAEVVPYAAVEIVRAPVTAVERTIEETQRAAFHQFLTDPATGPRLKAMVADNAATDKALACPWCPDFDPTTSARESHAMCADCRAEFNDADRGAACSANCGHCGRCR
jgi:hypothetical protein